jgi:hypothetical protein
MTFFNPHLDILPPPQRALWDELYLTPEHFTLYGGTALALHLGHRKSVDFDFFSSKPFEVDELIRSIPYLRDAEQLEVGKNTLTCLLDRDGKIKMQFFGGLSLGRIEPRQQPADGGFWVATPLDVGGTKLKVLPQRSEEKDYIDVDALLRNGITLPTMLAAAKVIYGPKFNAVLSLKGLSYFRDVPNLPDDMKTRLANAAVSVDLTKLPVLQSAQVIHGKENKL